MTIRLVLVREGYGEAGEPVEVSRFDVQVPTGIGSVGVTIATARSVLNQLQAAIDPSTKIYHSTRFGTLSLYSQPGEMDFCFCQRVSVMLERLASWRAAINR